MRTTSYADLKSRFESAIGVDSLLSVEETAFKNSLNDRVRQIWTRHRWPPLTAVVSKTLAAVDTSTLKADKAVQIDNATDLYDVYDVFTKNPFEDNTSRRLKFSLINGYLVVNKDVSETTVYVFVTVVINPRNSEMNETLRFNNSLDDVNVLWVTFQSRT